MVAGWKTASSSAPKVLYCLYTMKSCRYTAWWMSSAVALAVNARSSASEMVGGVKGACAMLAYGRASVITGPNEMLFGGVGSTEGSRAGKAKQGGAEVGMTGHGGVGAGESGMEVRAEGARLEGRDSECSRSEVGDGDGSQGGMGGVVF